MPIVEGLVERFAYAGIFLTLLLAGLGLPIPEETAILAAGVLAHQRVVRWWIALPLCLAGALAGDCALYWIGRRWGERILEWRPVRRVLSSAREGQLKAAYRDHGAKVVFTARHFAGFRAAAFLTAGIAGVSFWRFLVADSIAALVGVPIGFGVAYVFTDHLTAILRGVHRAQRWLGLLVIVGLVVWWAVVVLRRNRQQ